MSASVVRLSDVRRAVRRAINQRLPLESTDFAGRLIPWPAWRIADTAFDRLLRLGGVQSVIDLRDDALLGETRSRHLQRCDALQRWHIRYFRFGRLLAKAEREAVLPFDMQQRFNTLVLGEAALLRECWTRGAMLVLYPDHSPRLAGFQSALTQLGLVSGDPLAVPNRKAR